MSNGNGNGHWINAKTITSAGGIVLALFLAWGLIQFVTNDLSRVEGAINHQTAVQQDTNEVLRDLTAVVEGNTEVMRSLGGNRYIAQ